MAKHLKAVLAAGAIAVAGIAGVAVAQTYLQPDIGYQYQVYADAEKTIPTVLVTDSGCWTDGSTDLANRASIHTPYYDATPYFICRNGFMQLLPDW